MHTTRACCASAAPLPSSTSRTIGPRSLRVSPEDIRPEKCKVRLEWPPLLARAAGSRSPTGCGRSHLNATTLRMKSRRLLPLQVLPLPVLGRIRIQCIIQTHSNTRDSQVLPLPLNTLLMMVCGIGVAVTERFDLAIDHRAKFFLQFPVSIDVSIESTPY